MFEGTTFELDINQKYIDEGVQDSNTENAFSLAFAGQLPSDICCYSEPPEYDLAHKLAMFEMTYCIHTGACNERGVPDDGEYKVMFHITDELQDWIEAFHKDKESVQPIKVAGKVTDFQVEKPDLGDLGEVQHIATYMFFTKTLTTNELMGDGFDGYIIGTLDIQEKT